MSAALFYYDIIGVSADASLAEIKSAYRAAIRKYHPDVNAAPNAQRLTEILNDAYALLSDPAKRRVYDVALASMASPFRGRQHSSEVSNLYASGHRGEVAPLLSLLFSVWSIGALSVSSRVFAACLSSCGLALGMVNTSRSSDM